jgi:chromosomal replication initiation ATPase DnaA
MNTEPHAIVREWVKSGELTPQKILSVVVASTGISEQEILSDRRHSYLMKARHLYWACLREHCLMSYPTIGLAVGRNHTTIMSAVKKVPKEVIKAIGDICASS